MKKDIDDIKKSLGKVVRKNRKKMHFTQLSLENDNIISRKGLSDIETGKSACTLETLCMLINLFGITPEELIAAIYGEN